MPEISRYCIPYTPFSGALEKSCVGVVTTAGAHLRTQDPFVLEGDTSFRLIPADATIDQVTITHGDYDHADARADINCVLPLDVLRELVSHRQLGAITPEHLSMGFSQAMRDIKERVAPEIAQIVRRWKPDAILLTAG